MIMKNIPEIDTEKLYLAIALEDFGTQIFITENGDIETMGSDQHCVPEPRLYFGKASGDFSWDEWCMSTTENGKYVIENIDGNFDDAAAALESAVKEFGIPAEDYDELEKMVEIRFFIEKKEAD